MKPIRFAPEAFEEMTVSAKFYEKHSTGLGARFLAAIRDGVADIRAHPRRWRKIRSNVRRRLIGKFPYGILYREDTEQIMILAIMHLHRRPGYWTDRG